MIIELIERVFQLNNPSSREQAKQRLKLVIAHDRADLSPEILESMRQEILEVVTRYADIDLDQSEFSLESNQRATALIANLPIRKMKRKPPRI